MTPKSEDGGQGTVSQQMFGSQAPVYATSRVHVRDDSLDVLERLAVLGFSDQESSDQESSDQGLYRWAMDLGTGAGFTAFAMTNYAQHVLASDLTRPMLEQARRIGQERNLTNLALCQNPAEALPIASNSLDLVTCRVAGHHFADLAQALDEVRRVLRWGGVLLMADSVSPEDDAVADWMNDIELRRDFSHVKNRKISVIEAMLAERGIGIVQREHARVGLDFNEWVARAA